MALTRKKLWIWTYAGLCAFALLFILFGPKRRHTSTPDPPVPAAQLGAGSGCDLSELPRALDEVPPKTVNVSQPSEETPEQKQARYRITACMLQKLWPTASIQFKWDQSGVGHFDLVFPNNAYRRASVISMSQLQPTGATFAAFVWLPHVREIETPLLVVARADRDGRVSYENALALDADGRISEDHVPEWTKTDDNRFEFTYEADYGTAKAHIAWTAVIDAASAQLVSRVPTRVTLADGTWLLHSETLEGATILLNASGSDRTWTFRLACERTSGTDCVVSPNDLLSELAQVHQ